MAISRTIRPGRLAAFVLVWSAVQPAVSMAADPVNLAELRLPTSLFKSGPENVADLKAIQNHVNLVIKEVMSSVVSLKVGSSQGSGVVVSEDGYILTAGHVVGTPNREVEIRFPDGKKVKGITLSGNRDVDNGMMKITTPGKYPFVEKGKSGSVKVGDWCMTIAHPGGWKTGRTPPVRLGRVIYIQDDLIQTDCTLVGGDSGGPLFDMRGKVIGINSRIGPKITDNIHVPVDTYVSNWDWLVKAEAWVPGKLNITYGDDARGCRIADVTPGGAADKAQLQKGDVITSFNNKLILGYVPLLEALRLCHAGDVVSLNVRRGTDNMRVQVTLDEKK